MERCRQRLATLKARQNVQMHVPASHVLAKIHRFERFDYGHTCTEQSVKLAGPCGNVEL